MVVKIHSFFLSIVNFSVHFYLKYYGFYGDLKILVANTNLSTLSISQNSPSILITTSNITYNLKNGGSLLKTKVYIASRHGILILKYSII